MKKKIAFVIESLNLGGAETSLITLLNNIDYNCFDVDLILFTKVNYFINLVPEKVKIVYVEFPNLNFFERIVYKLKRTFNFKHQHHAQLLYPLIRHKLVLNTANYDVIHAYNQGFVTYYAAEKMTSNHKNAWINIDYKHAGYSIHFDIDFYLKYEKVIVISDEVKNGFLAEVNKTLQNVETDIVKLFTDEVVLEKRASEKIDYVFSNLNINIVTACRLSKQKGLHLAVESCKQLLDAGYNINWFVVGEGPEREYLEKLIHEFNLSNKFFLLGQTLNPFPYMKHCDIYVQTSLFEGWGLTLIEAVLLKKHVVTTNFPTAYDIVEHEKTGLISEMNVESLTQNIKRLIKDDNLKKELDLHLSTRGNPDKNEALLAFNALNINS